MDVMITKGTQSLKADILMKNSESTDIWEYYVRNLEAKDDFGVITADRVYISQKGKNRLAPLVDELMQASFNIDFDVSEMMNYRWEQLTREDTHYQMGFIVLGNIMSGVDSYGVKADFVMNSDRDILEEMHIKTSDGVEMGTYNRSEEPYKIFYNNNDVEYLYLY